MIKSIRSLRRDLLIIFLISILTIVLIDFWFINIPVLFKGGEKIGQIVYKLCFSYISAFIFYFLVVHLKNQKDKENLYSYISINTLKVIGQAKAVINESARSSNITLKGSYPDSLELKSICNAINPNSNSPLVLGRIGNYANWMQYFYYYKRRSNEATNKVLSKVQFLDSVLVHKLAKIEDCTHFDEITMFVNIPIQNTDLSAFESGLSEYFDLIIDLERYYDKKLVEYK